MYITVEGSTEVEIDLDNVFDQTTCDDLIASAISYYSAAEVVEAAQKYDAEISFKDKVVSLDESEITLVGAMIDIMRKGMK